MNAIKATDKNHRGSASQFFVAGELCRRGYAAVVTMGNTPNTDILCSNIDGTRFVHVQVKTYIPHKKGGTCTVGMKAEKCFGDNFFWVLGGIPTPDEKSSTEFEYYIIPSSVMAKNVKKSHESWLAAPGKKGNVHQDSSIRTVHIPPAIGEFSWSIEAYKNRWDLIEQKLT